MFMAHIHYDASIEGMQLSNSAGRSSHIQVMFTALYRLYCKNNHISAKKISIDEISKLYHLIAANPWEKHWPNIRSSNTMLILPG